MPGHAREGWSPPYPGLFGLAVTSPDVKENTHIDEERQSLERNLGFRSRIIDEEQKAPVVREIISPHTRRDTISSRRHTSS